MRLKEELKKSLELALWNKILIGYFVVALPFVSLAEPVIADIPFPPASFTHVTDLDILNKIGLEPGPAWCYYTEANAIIITAPARERANCELKLMYELEKQKFKYEFKIDKLNLRIETLTNQHKEILIIKDEEISRLTAAALKRPNDYSFWWASGGLLAGVLITLGITAVAK